MFKAPAVQKGSYQLDNFIALGETAIDEVGGGDYFADLLFFLLEENLCGAYEDSCKLERTAGHFNHPVLYYYGQDDSWIYWFNPIMYLPKKKE